MEPAILTTTTIEVEVGTGTLMVLMVETAGMDMDRGSLTASHLSSLNGINTANLIMAGMEVLPRIVATGAISADRAAGIDCFTEWSWMTGIETRFGSLEKSSVALCLGESSSYLLENMV